MVKAVFVTYLIALSIIVSYAYKQECAVGPQYWCKSFQNAQDCGALRHCTDTVWRYDEKFTQINSSTKCEWCQKILENTHKAIQNIPNNADLIRSTLINGCKLLPLQDISSLCTAMIENYETTVLSLMKHQRYDKLCHLMDICSSETTKVNKNEQKIHVDEQSKILCNVIVRATKELHVNQHKTRNEIQMFLKNDCQLLNISQLVHKCKNLVERHGNEIYAHVASNVELSKVCDYIDNSAVQSIPQEHCELCTFVLSSAKQMLDTQQTEDKVLIYIDEQICSRLTGNMKKDCKKMIDTNGRDLINNIQHGTQPMLLCTYFQICLDKIVDRTSPISKNEMSSFLMNNLCEKLGSHKSACQALIQKDSTHLLQVLTNEISGKELCHMFGLCPKKSPVLDEANLKDDPNKCKRCVKDFTRRKHIAERLVNRSSEFLHHLCGQLPDQDTCIKAVDQSINELLTFIQSLDPKDICVQLNMCDHKLLENIQLKTIIPSENTINEEIFEYIKNDVCIKLGPLSSFCIELVNTEGLHLLNAITKQLDPHRICTILDICPSNPVFTNCQDKCQCCTNKVEIYQRQLENFMRTIVASTRIMCDHVPGRDECLRLADIFESNVNKVVARFDSKYVCRLLSLCTDSQEKINEDQCQTCKNKFDIRQNRFRTTINDITTTLLSLCNDNQCRLRIQTTQQETLDKINNLNSTTLCQRIGYCASENSIEPSVTLLRLRSLVQHQTKTLEQRLESNDICSEFGQLRPMCEHLMSSPQNHRYAYVYMALLKNSRQPIDDDLREQMSTTLNTDVCISCKNAVQSSKGFWENALESVRNVLLRTCEHCSAKDQCRDFYNQRFDNIKSYITNIDQNQFCQSLHLCSSSSSLIINKNTDICSTCIERLESKKAVILQGINRISLYFNNICQRFSNKQCEIFVKQISNSFEESIRNFDPKQACSSIGFCSTEMKRNSQNEIQFSTYEKYLEDEIDKNVCSILGPFENLCKEIIRGNIKQVQAIGINYNIKDLMLIGEKLNQGNTINYFSAANLNECSRDKCQCCIDRITQKKECIKNIGDKVIAAFIRSCDYCPVKDQCQKYWQDYQSKFDSCINDIDPKQVCTRLGFCNVSSLCANMGSFQQSCEEALNTFTDPIKHSPPTSVAVLPTKPEDNIEEFTDSNSTCILCEYIMNILANYINDQSTEEEIQINLEKVCNGMPKNLEKQCRELIENYAPSIIATLTRRFDPSTICHKLNLCTNQMKVNPTNLIKANQASCSICDYVSTYINFALKRDDSDKSLNHALSTVCTHLSNEQQSQCQTLVQLFTPHIRQLKLQLGDNFCKQLTICQTPMNELEPGLHLNRIPSKQKSPIQKNDQLKEVMIKNLDTTPQCVLCHYVVSYLDAALKNNKSEAAIEAALRKVCTLLPRKDRARCGEFVRSYGSALVELISEVADPQLICRYLGMCEVISPKDRIIEESLPTTYSNRRYARIPV